MVRGDLTRKGLTGREMEVLRLLCAGLNNRLIAGKLMRSERTIEHHVSAILAKTGTHSRSALMDLGLPQPDRHSRDRLRRQGEQARP